MNKSAFTWLLIISFCSLFIFGTSCHTSKSFQGGVAGAGAGGAVGGIIGHKKGNTAIGAIIGATAGGVIGAAIGRYMDKQAEELERSIEGAEVERVGEGILVTFDSGLLFGFDSYALTPATKNNLDNLSETLNEYKDTDLLIEGHTDATGSSDYNLQLSRQRAQAVVSYLSSHGISKSRITTQGYGEQQPVASNDTESGREANRRVELAIFANEDLKEAAATGALSYN